MKDEFIVPLQPTALIFVRKAGDLVTVPDYIDLLSFFH